MIKQFQKLNHFLAEIELGCSTFTSKHLKAKTIINYNQYDAAKGFELAAEWYFNNYQNKHSTKN
ncbi:MAG: hypothetical protein IPK06_07100 [Ignavibacteriae bacterium]|nr:hypothetical protein [Ignavibacteriota bacterium]